MAPRAGAAPSLSGTALRARLRLALRTEPDRDGLSSRLVHHVPGRYCDQGWPTLVGAVASA
jgi:hypothetical protein